MESNKIIEDVLKELEFFDEEKKLFYDLLKYTKFYQLDKSIDYNKKILGLIEDYTLKAMEEKNEIQKN